MIVHRFYGENYEQKVSSENFHESPAIIHINFVRLFHHQTFALLCGTLNSATDHSVSKVVTPNLNVIKQIKLQQGNNIIKD